MADATNCMIKKNSVNVTLSFLDCFSVLNLLHSIDSISLSDFSRMAVMRIFMVQNPHKLKMTTDSSADKIDNIRHRFASVSDTSHFYPIIRYYKGNAD